MNYLYYAIYLLVILTASIKSTESKSLSSGSCIGHYPTGSVLFHNKKCWQHEDLVLLSARKTMQNLIPTNPLDVTNDGYVISLIDYFRMCFSVVQKMSSGRSQDILLLALADAIGGYMRYYVIPVTTQSYYCGNIRYDYARKLFNFYEEIKVHLDTSGKRWAKPIDTSKMDFKTRALSITPLCQDDDPCAHLQLNEPQGEDTTECKSTKSSLIPMPYMDDVNAPSSIAMPFRSSRLIKLCSPGAAFILEKYYVIGTTCLMSRGGSNVEVASFNTNLYKWLQQTVVPRLNDDQWYPAFGGVQKILKTIQKNGYVDKSMEAEGLASNGQKSKSMDSEIGSQDESMSSEGNQSAIGMFSLLLAVGFALLTTWILAMLCWCCYRRRRNRCEQSGAGQLDLNKADGEGYQFINTFVQIFYDMKNGGSKIEPKNSSGSSETTPSQSSAPNRKMLGSSMDIEDQDQDSSGNESTPLIKKNESGKVRGKGKAGSQPTKSSRKKKITVAHMEVQPSTSGLHQRNSRKMEKAKSAPLPTKNGGGRNSASTNSSHLNSDISLMSKEHQTVTGTTDTTDTTDSPTPTSESDLTENWNEENFKGGRSK